VIDDFLDAAGRLPALLVAESALLSAAFKFAIVVLAGERTACGTVLALPLDTGNAICFAHRGFHCIRQQRASRKRRAVAHLLHGALVEETIPKSL